MFCNASERSIVRYRKGKSECCELDYIIEETPVAIAFNGVAYTVMMCTPNDLEQFAIGFSLSEGIIDHHRDIHDIEMMPTCDGININVTIANRCVARLQQKRRSLAGLTGCGICGEEKLETVCRALDPVPSSVQFDLGFLDPVLQQLLRKQQLNQLTGSAHAAVYINQQGQVEAIFEDVGRHIALDKLVGCIHQRQLRGGAVLVTSRASFEMVQKAASAGVEVLLAISSATKMAVDLAEKLNLTLLGHCRNGRADAYAHPERITGMI
ncbi:formate dehydrogenase accessory sulfurtransferase FdhD [Photobacterium phosphoreum]|uniref:formate dehydrogenase accessory sulfurtransferase FdhD n=1 Tax=Photobacterium phosphoreum TaxID=659 RepID=UPI0007F8AAE1|nr:formate dehydrogenase accessory sulfurtransferase FdhD [Photobacterium phosphoreum]MCD9475199.1 formate dehydrogenase accessory sulfurtransferase FdhD [Photobacterium phosphoreum]MCF2175900.1 formate dehydrogenase accessory sulfurtransferase FdhD [Photobacterium phosphoreum]OBU31344.1 formate dehydrogenase family accessory protein FdhD [Photobacterium phosphoreum]PSU78891.1 formate dehydrogenase accessory sulfurtransferase FdhD [Photobacterium phosphoreum]